VSGLKIFHTGNVSRKPQITSPVPVRQPQNAQRRREQVPPLPFAMLLLNFS
jgi:hypothetical protein